MAKRQFITFKLGDDLFGIDILLVREINHNLDITPIDQSPSFIKGLINLRGLSVIICDLRVLLGFPPIHNPKEANYIVLKTNAELQKMSSSQKIEKANASTSNDLFGFIVDEIGDVVLAEPTPLRRDTTKQINVSTQFVEGVVKLNDELLSVLQPSKILALESVTTTASQ